ncbi:glucosylglycerol hydrolase [Salinirubellus sp. GCM10025818]|uniref:glucosylglycerol hydrolase n=1 Tax=Salinirubellus TaxID=2162630 RepID=UPI0030D550E6
MSEEDNGRGRGSGEGAGEPRILAERTDALVDRQRRILDDHDDRFEAAKELVEHLGAQWRSEEEGAGDGYAEVGFWTPELADEVPADAVELEVLTAREPVDLGTETTVEFDRAIVETRRKGEFTWAAVEGMRPGTRDQLGSLYRLVYEHDGERGEVLDPLASSLPFGAYAPAELYDLASLDRERPDREHFRSFGTDEEAIPTTEDDGLPRVDPATSMLEVHPGTATETGSLGALARRLREIAAKQRDGDDLTPADRNFLGYDAIQLMPVEPITENEDHPGYFRPEERSGDRVEVTVESPDMLNWGYDIVVAGFPAVNPALLETGRPDELVDFIAACHDMPRPVRVVFDIALGHADNGALDLLNDRFLSGPGMYGQELDYTEPVVRAILLEMQRRKMEFGADGIRVDGAQDFTNWSEERGEWHDDEFLAEMDRVTQEVGGTEYRPWMIYEDGRPWPREDWELASTYRTLIEQHPHSFQWSPVTFAHNTPALLTFWATKWWRVREVADFGSNWITGVANHDTVRRGGQRSVGTSWEDDPINPHLGETPTEIIDAAYDSPAANALMHCFLPGVPMDFLNANFRGPWGFVRDTDAPWNVKVVAEEHNVAEWQIRETDYPESGHFRRLKELGFEDAETLRWFMHTLYDTVSATDFDLDGMPAMLAPLDPPLGDGDPTPEDLERFGYAWMRDFHEFASLGNWADRQDDERTAFDRAVREFRHERPWLRGDVREEEAFDYRHPADGTVLYYGHRVAPDGSESLLFLANMEGVSAIETPTDLPVEGLPADGWEPVLVSPGVGTVAADEPVTLDNGEVVVFSRE